jgi:hypothetical protein
LSSSTPRHFFHDSTADVTRSGELTADELKAMFAAREFPLDDGAIAHTLQKMVHGMCAGKL